MTNNTTMVSPSSNSMETTTIWTTDYSTSNTSASLPPTTQPNTRHETATSFTSTNSSLDQSLTTETTNGTTTNFFENLMENPLFFASVGSIAFSFLLGLVFCCCYRQKVKRCVKKFSNTKYHYYLVKPRPIYYSLLRL